MWRKQSNGVSLHAGALAGQLSYGAAGQTVGTLQKYMPEQLD